MRLPLLTVAIMLVIDVIFDGYILYAIRTRLKRREFWSRLHIAASLGMVIAILAVMIMPKRRGSDFQLLGVMWMLYAYLTVYLPKIIWVISDLLSALPCLMHRKRLEWLSVTGAVIGVVTFFVMWWGALFNRFNIDEREVEIEIPGLPEAFDGYRIVQFSDIHVGTYGTDTTFVSRLVDVINATKPDMIVFTGDIVNRHTDELPPFVKPLSRLDAPDGVYSVLGNHDYGDYMEWPSAEAKAENMREMIRLQHDMGWHLLLNDNVMIRRDNDSIAIVGVENIGDPPFKVYGSLSAAYPAIGDDVTKILLTHNPAHWTDSIAGKSDVNVGLSLSGHTHAMQIELAGFSPACFRYNTWGGKYTDETESHTLYVNIGAGAVGLPMRIGATPEITVLTLRK